MSFAHLEEQETPVFRATYSFVSVTPAERIISNNAFNYFEDINDRYCKSETMKSMQPEMSFDIAEFPIMHTTPNQNVIPEAAAKLLGDLSEVENYLLQVREILMR